MRILAVITGYPKCGKSKLCARLRGMIEGITFMDTDDFFKEEIKHSHVVLFGSFTIDIPDADKYIWLDVSERLAIKRAINYSIEKGINSKLGINMPYKTSEFFYSLIKEKSEDASKWLDDHLNPHVLQRKCKEYLKRCPQFEKYTESLIVEYITKIACSIKESSEINESVISHEYGTSHFQNNFQM